MNRLEKEYHKIKEWLESLNQNKIVPGLKRINLLMNLLSNPQDELNIIVVGGTNAKGSTCFNLNYNLTRHGIRVGCFTSPHLHTVRERIQIGNQKISMGEFTEYGCEIKKIIEEKNIQATYFEILTAIAYLYFYRKEVEYAIMEIGLGGEWDAVNIANPIISILTTLGIDHTNYLGDKIDMIASTKAKIVRKNSHVITGWPKEYHKYIPENKSLSYGIQIMDWINIAIQKLNLKIDTELYPVMGRMEKFSNYTIDTAHNPQAIDYLIKKDDDYESIILGILEDKDIKGIIEKLPEKSEILACNLDVERSASNTMLMETCTKLNYKCKKFDSTKEAILYANSRKTLIVGSFYTVASARSHFRLDGHSEL